MSCPQPSPESKIRRHLTAMSRNALSRPMRLALEAGAIGETHLDYGCGRGDDVMRLRQAGYAVQGYDPHYMPKEPQGPFESVSLIYVLNVIEDPREREHSLHAAWELASDRLILAVRCDKVKGEPFSDGVITSRRTFQKTFSHRELVAYVETVCPHAEIERLGRGVLVLSR